MSPLNICILLARVAISTVAVKLGAAGLAFGLNVYLARLLGSQHYGDYVLALSWISILVLFGTLGMEGTALRFIAGYVGLEAWGLLRGFIWRGVQWVMAASFSIVLLFCSGLFFVKSALRPTLVDIFMIGLALVPISALLAYIAACLQGLNSAFVALAQSVQLLRILFFGTLILGLVAYDPNLLDPVVAMGLNSATAMLVLVVVTIFFFQKFPRQTKEAQRVFESRQWIVTALPLLAMSGFHLIITQIDTIMIGMFMGTENAGFYTAASRISVLITFGIASVNAVVAPMIAQYFAQQKLRELQNLVSIAAKGILFFALSTSVILLVFGEKILGWFGSGFSVAYLSLAILLFGQLIDSLAGSVGYLMTMTGHQREMMIVVGGCAMLNIVLNTILIPMFGLEGAAIATATTIAMWNAILVWRVKSNLNINSTAFHFQGR